MKSGRVSRGEEIRGKEQKPPDVLKEERKVEVNNSYDRTCCHEERKWEGNNRCNVLSVPFPSGRVPERKKDDGKGVLRELNQIKKIMQPMEIKSRMEI